MNTLDYFLEIKKSFNHEIKVGVNRLENGFCVSMFCELIESDYFSVVIDRVALLDKIIELVDYQIGWNIEFDFAYLPLQQDLINTKKTLNYFKLQETLSVDNKKQKVVKI